MKRWQTRGEVQDSDEEEISLDAETQSLQHPSKRVKILKEDEDIDKQDEEQPQAKQSEDALLGKEDVDNARHQEESAEATSISSPTPSHAFKNTTVPAGTAVQDDDNEPDWTVRTNTKTYGRLHGTSREPVGRMRELFPVITQAEQDAVDATSLHATYDLPSSSMLPEDPVASPGHQAQTPRPLNVFQPTFDSISTASSPLSELSDPPGSPPEFLSLPESSHAQHQVRPDQSSAANGIEHIFELDDPVLPPALLTQGARRLLRARQEKQLHPYMYDKAQYQQQCRERGLRPVRLLEQAAQETQDASLGRENGEITSSATRPSSSSSSLGGLMSSGIPLEDSLRSDPEHSNVYQAEDDLPDIDNLIRARAVPGKLHSRKRQKLVHKSSRGILPKHHDGQEDEFTVPPSPPPSSKGSAPRTVKAPRGFRLPRGLSPMPLPTPQISSDLRPVQGITTTTLSDEDTPPRTARRFARVRSAVTIGSDSPTDSESAPEDDQQVLNRERRRIRGVLPASWLNIDRKTLPKPNSVGTDDNERDAPAPQSVPQKGVARKLHRQSTAHLGLNVLEISDEDEVSGTDVSTPTATQRDAPASTSRLNSAVAPDYEDVDNMELDWFDPMLAGAGRAPRVPGRRTKPRSENIEPSMKSSKPDFSEERNGLRRAYNPNPLKRQGASGKRRSKSRQQKRAPALGILDAPEEHGNTAPSQPQFVRLAARQALRGSDGGRHSPSNKVIRLATREDTEQANATLENWRRGAIPPRKATERRQGASHPEHPSRVTQVNPHTPHANATEHFPTSRNPSVPSKPRLPSMAQDNSFARPTSHSVGSHRKGARKDAPQRRQAVSTVIGLHGRRQTMSRNAAAPTARYRGAQLETQESTYMQQSRSAAFQQRIQCLTETVTRRPVTTTVDALPMTRFLQESNPFPQKQHSPQSIQSPEQNLAQPLRDGVPLPQRVRKRRTQRVDVDTRQYRQPSEPLPDINTLQVSEHAHVSDSGPTLRGLGPSGTRYATDFDVRHLPTSTYFHESTFIGSGDLASALAVGDRNMEQNSGSLRIYIKGNMLEWAAWSEQVRAAMAEIPSAILDALKAVDCMPSPQRDGQTSAVTSNVEHMLRSTIRYISNCLYFLDAIDRKTCCQALDQLVGDTIELTEQTDIWTANFESLRRRVLQNILVIARQNQALGNDTVVTATMRADLGDRTAKISSRLAMHLIPGCLEDLRTEYEEQRVLSTREMGIRRDDSISASVVILHQCTRTSHSMRSSFWDVVGKALRIDPSNVQVSSEIDAAWYSIFSILPCLDFNATGIIQRRPKDDLETGWRLPNQLVERCLELYPATSAIRGSSINEYVRATFSRCSHLFAKWNWWRSESTLSTVYDFFARRGLNLLHNEDGHGSPEFLENLTCVEDVSMEVRADDRSFSIFLKLLASSLRTWTQFSFYTDKKIGGIAWRIIPNHARIYRKDAEVQRTDLDALRNHFDLLCTLYFASPPLHRLRVDMLRNLVDHSTSHREACRISVRAWSRLASFQMSTEEPTDKLTPFFEWFKDMLQTTVAQYRLARTEAEQQYADAKASGATSLNNEILENTISSNQRQIAATIVDLLAAYRRALTSASCAEAARLLVTECEPWKAIESFHPSERRLVTVYNEMLDVFKTTVDVQQRLHITTSSHTQSEDSQDYGDMDILQEFATGQGPSDNTTEQNLVALMHEAFAQLVSDAFGSEMAPDDTLLSRLLDTWMQCAKHLVSDGLRSWSNFLVDYNAGAWNQLRETVQSRKFTPYVLAAILEADADAFDTLRSTYLGAWLKSLVERESTLKYQHLLTEAILNVSSGSNEPILQNLPFSKAPEAPNYHVTLQELRQRRLALISSVLSNMLEHYNQTLFDLPRMLPELGRVYSELVRGAMQAMKSNYQELQQDHSGDTAEINIRGDYVIFVQEVVAFLQQYMIEGVYTVDRFFLDSSAFPLPADDPTYVVGRLRKHVPKLAEAKTRKQLATFLHNISERAAFDQQQDYLADQLYKAMSGTLESGDMGAPSLRHVLLTSIIPIYIENGIGDTFTWILAAPMIDASARTVADLLYDTDMSSEDSVAAVTEQMALLLGAVQKAFAHLHMSMEMLKSARVLGSIRSMFKLCEATVVFTNHVKRSTGNAEGVLRQLQDLQRQANRIEGYLAAPEDFFEYGMDDVTETDSTCQWQDTYAFTSKQVRESMVNDWSLFDERYFVKRGNGSREVVVQVGGYDEERVGALEAIEYFRRICERQYKRGIGSRRGRRGGDGDAFGLDNLVI